MTLLVTKQSLFNLYNTYLPKISTRLFYFLIAQLLHTKKAADFVICCLFLIFPAYDSYKQNTISSVSERLFSFSLLYLIRKAEHDFYATLPSLWISFHEILHSGLSDVWASCVALLLCCLTPYLWPFSPRPGRWKF